MTHKPLCSYCGVKPGFAHWTGCARPLALVAMLLLTGCAASQPKVERYCPGGPQGDVCYMRASPEQVDRHCRKSLTKWDNGQPVLQQDGVRARCCTKTSTFGRDAECQKVLDACAGKPDSIAAGVKKSYEDLAEESARATDAKLSCEENRFIEAGKRTVEKMKEAK